MKRLDLTGDRPLGKSEARKLARWWLSAGWSVVTEKAGRRFYSVTAYHN